MSLLTVSPSVPTIELTTRRDVLKKFCRESGGLGEYGTATSGGTTFLVDTVALLGAGMVPEDLDRAYVYFSSGSAAGSIRPVTNFIPEEGRIEWDTPTATIAASDIYFIIRAPHPQRLLDYIDDLLTEELWQPTFAFCSEVPDYDMEQSTTAGDWDSVNATLSKETATPALNGRYLKVLATAANGYAESGTPLYVARGKAFHASIAVRTNGDTNAIFRAYDATNGATIAEVSTDRQHWVRLFLDLTIPATCDALKFRLITETDAESTYWDDLVFFPLGMKQVSLPWWIRHRDQVKGIFKLSPEKFADTDHWLASMQGSRERGWDAVDNMRTGRHELQSTVTVTNLPLYIHAVRNETAYASDTETKHVNLNWLTALLMEKVFSGMSGWRSAGTTDTKWLAEQQAKWTKAARLERYRATTRLESVFTAPEPMGHYR